MPHIKRHIYLSGQSRNHQLLNNHTGDNANDDTQYRDKQDLQYVHPADHLLGGAEGFKNCDRIEVALAVTLRRHGNGHRRQHDG